MLESAQVRSSLAHSDLVAGLPIHIQHMQKRYRQKLARWQRQNMRICALTWQITKQREFLKLATWWREQEARNGTKT
jgi:hypothetical protein